MVVVHPSSATPDPPLMFTWAQELPYLVNSQLASDSLGDFGIAFQANTGSLSTVGAGPGSSDMDLHLGMVHGKSPATTTR